MFSNSTGTFVPVQTFILICNSNFINENYVESFSTLPHQIEGDVYFTHQEKVQVAVSDEESSLSLNLFAASLGRHNLLIFGNSRLNKFFSI